MRIHHRTLLVILSIASCCAAQSQNTAILPVPKIENDSYDWYARHKAVLEIKDRVNPEIVMIGDSITHFWSGEPKSNHVNGPESWKSAFGDRRVLNMGFGWDRTQNVLWRLDHGEFDGLKPKWVFLNIGTNNFSTTKNAKENTPEEVAEAIKVICGKIKTMSPETKIVVMAVFPRGEKPDNPYRGKIAALNKLLAEWTAQSHAAEFVDIGPKFLQPDGTISKEIMPGFVHPNDKGYAFWAEAIRKIISKE